jgi:hypothetical protein
LPTPYSPPATRIPKCPVLASSFLVLANIHPLGLEVDPRLEYLLLNLLVRFRHVVEGEDAVAELEKEVSAEGDESPEGDL